MGFVIITDMDLKINEIVFSKRTNDLLSEGRLLISYTIREDRTKVLNFVHNIIKKEAVFGYEINFKIDNENVLYNFSGIKVEEDQILIMAFKKRKDETGYYNHLMELNNQYINKIRKLIKKQDSTVVTDNNSSLYDEISKINNDLTTLQRKLTKTNKELSYQKEVNYSTLKAIGEGVIAINERKNIRFINQAAEDILNISDEQKENINIKKDIKIFNKNQKNIFNSIVERAYKDAKLIKKEDLLLENNNKKTPVDLTVSPVVLDDNKIIGVVIVITNISLKKEQEKRLKKLAATDRLTNIMNRRMGIKYLEKQIERVKREEIALTVCFIDINGLKVVNDRYGHKEGDRLLKEAANILTNTIRSSDAVARVGGDEFLIIFSACDKSCVRNIWSRVKKEIDKWNQNNKKNYKMSLSKGFAKKYKDDGKSIEDLIEEADKKMYKDKEEFYQ